jgi:mannosyltransferase
MTSVQTSAVPSREATRPEDDAPLDRRTEYFVLGGLVAVALALGFLALGRAEFFADEAYTWSTVNNSFGSMVRIIVEEEAFQILHDFLLWPVNAISDSSFALRLPSVLCFAATVPAVWASTRRLFGQRAALVAALLLAVNAFALQYAQEARSYALAMMFAAWAAFGLVREVLEPTRWSRALWVGCSVAAVWSHGMAVFAIVAQIGSLLLLPDAARRGRGFLRAALLIGVLVAPAVIAPQLHVDRGESFPSADAPTITTFRILAWQFAGRSVFALVPYALGGAIAIWSAVEIARARGRSIETWRFGLPFIWLLFPPAFLIAYSFVDPIWLVRYAVPSLPALAVLVGYGLSRIRPVRVLAVVLAFTVAAAAWGIVRWYDNPGFAHFNEIVATLDDQARPGDAVALATDRSRIPFEFALRHEGKLRDELDPAFPDAPWGDFIVGDQSGAPLTEAAVRELGDEHDRVWMIAGFYDPDAEIAQSIERMRSDYRLTSRRDYGGPLVLYLFERTGA